MKNFSKAALLDGNNHSSQSGMHWKPYDWVAGIGSVAHFSIRESFLTKFQVELDQSNDWWFGFFGYDLKNEIENLRSGNEDHLGFPEGYFFLPEMVITCAGQAITLHIHEKSPGSANAKGCYESICQTPAYSKVIPQKISFRKRMAVEYYIKQVSAIKEHIRLGDIYELNFCQEFYAENMDVEPLALFLMLQEAAQGPFSCYFRINNRYIISASPERFLRKEGLRIFSQPMKGTAQRGSDESSDLLQRTFLSESSKEKSENVMIVDLVRNDLSAIAARGSVRVDELYGIYSFPRVHQMVSTVSCLIQKNKSLKDIIQNTFPMGSMTGAPKIKSMELIERFEQTRRGVFSGTAGYIHPSGDFDFNVVIRSVLYNAEAKYLSVMAGSAITWHSDAMSEYEECLLKARYIIEAIGGQLDA